MAKVVNLNKFRKQKAREAAAATAAENRIRFGRTKAEKARDAESAKAGRDHVDAHRLDPTDAPAPDDPA